MRSVAVAAILLAVSAQAGEVKLKLTGKDLTGVGTAFTQINADGSKLQRLSTRVTSRGTTAEIIDESLCSKTGRPLRRVVKTSTGGKLVQIITVGFGNKEVSIKVQAGGETKSASRQYPQGSLDVKSEFWFISSKPAPGSTETYFNFEIESLTWSKKKVTYVGEQKIKINGKEVSGHLMQGEDGRAWLDAKGDPLKMEWGDVTVVRA